MNGLSWEDDGAQEGLLTRRSAQNCLSDHELEEYLFDRLSGVTREVIEEHLLVCERCQDRVEAEESYTSVFRQAARQAEANDFAEAMGGGAAEPRRGWRAALAAGWATVTGQGYGRRLLLAAASLAVVGAGIAYSPLMRGPAAETAVMLDLARGAGDMTANAPAGNALRLSAEVTELPPLPRWRVEVVNATGALEQSAEMTAVGGRLNWQVKDGLPSGQHWVRLRDARDGSLVREFGLQIK